MLPTWFRAVTPPGGALPWAFFVAAPLVCRLWQSRQRPASSLVDRADISAEMTSEERVQYWLPRDEENDFLEDVLGDRALAWVQAQNAETKQRLGDPAESPLYRAALGVLNARDKIPFFSLIGDDAYNFWQDEAHPRGILRRCRFVDYTAPEPPWETVLDVDALGAAEGESWVYKGHRLFDLDPAALADPAAPLRTLLFLSRGGSDAVVVREFDLRAKRFVSDRPFHVSLEAKTTVAWRDADALWIGTDLGPGALTSSGYPRVVREWTRGAPLSVDTTREVFAGAADDVSVDGRVLRHDGYRYAMLTRATSFYTQRVRFQLQAVPATVAAATAQRAARWLQRWATLPLPDDVDAAPFRDQLLLTLRSDWTLADGARYAAGSLLAVPIVDVLDAAEEAAAAAGTGDAAAAAAPLRLSRVTQLFAPTPTTSLDGYAALRDVLVLTTLDAVKTQLRVWRLDDRDGGDGAWRFVDAEPAALIRGVSLTPLDRHSSNAALLAASSFLTPTELRLVDDAARGAAAFADARLLRALPRQFDADPAAPDALTEEQFFATSADGTRVPYFVLAPRGLARHGRHAALLYGYGGFEVSLTPAYAAVLGATWLDRAAMAAAGARALDADASVATLYVVANVRGGGEFGPAWHQAALRAHRHRAYDDFIAVADDLCARGFTSPSRLAIRGGSNGGLLVGNVLTRRPALCAAVVCAVPLLDMRRYHRLLAGASWQAEYGCADDADDWRFLQRYSAYHQIDPATAARRGSSGGYPALLVTTSTRDDRVHPYHARAFVKRLRDASGAAATAPEAEAAGAAAVGRGDVFYFENLEGGHGGAADHAQQAALTALSLGFLARVLLSA